MYIEAYHLGYRELSRIADFIRKIEDGNENFQNLISVYDRIGIGYDIHYDDIKIICDNDQSGIDHIILYPADLDIEL